MREDNAAEDIIKKFIITIDGPAGSGKSTTASLLAGRLGLLYLDTGAMYRAVTYAALRDGVNPEDEEAVSRTARMIDIELRYFGGKPHFYLDGENIEREIRAPGVSKFVSPVSRYAGVRTEMVRLQRKIGAKGGLVVEGRDTGSVVFPFAHVKIYLVADIEARSGRRLLQMKEMGIEQEIKEIKQNIMQRDSIDSSRSHSPLVRPPGSFLVDTSGLTIDEQVAEIESHARTEAERLAKLCVPPGGPDPFAAMNRYYRISHWLVRSFYRLFFGLGIHGDENLRFRENFIFACNHLSYADPPLVGCTLNREVYFLAKKELFRNTLLARLIRAYHAIPIDRDDIDRKTLQDILHLLRKGKSIMMFPEGTRSRDGGIGELKIGLGFIARHAGSTVVPIHVSGSNRLLACLLRRKKLQVRIGPPIRIVPGYESDDKKRDYRILTSMVRNEIRMLKDEAEA